nr:uncharacterized transporter YutK-like [Nerophis lumbriciformis]
MDKAISFLGLAVIMGIAWVFSKHRGRVNFRTVIWGVGLQLLLAVVILRTDTASFVGMFVLASLVVIYLLSAEAEERGWSQLAAAATAVAGAAAVVALGRFLHPFRVTDGLIAAALLLLLTGAWRKRAHWVRWSMAALLPLGVAALWARGIDGRALFQGLSDRVASFLNLSTLGSEFLFGNLVKPEYWFPAGSDSFWPGFGVQFAFAVLPTIIFFSAFIAVMYHLGIVQVIITAMARFMRWSMKTSGSETVSCSANVFVGQTEAPFLVKPFLEGMTISELHAIMVGGFATVAGGVLAGYIQMGVNPGHLIAASVMSAPAALVIAKLLYPETEESMTSGDIDLPDVRTADNVVGAAANGTTDGLKLALNVGAMLIAFIALIGFLDVVLGWADGWVDGRLLGGSVVQATGEYAGIFPGSMKTLFGTVLRPLAFIMGVPWEDSAAVGNLLGIKMTVNEFVAYGLLGEAINNGEMGERAQIIATYALCGFANFSSIGIQIGGLGAVAPGRRRDLAKVGLRAMFGGALASFMTATVAGILL